MSKQFGWKTVVAAVALAAGGAYAAGSFGSGAAVTTALLYGAVLWAFASVAGSYYGRWRGWDGQ